MHCINDVFAPWLALEPIVLGLDVPEVLGDIIHGVCGLDTATGINTGFRAGNDDELTQVMACTGFNNPVDCCGCD